MAEASRSNPLVGRFDAGTLSKVEGAVRQALRPIRTRFVNRFGTDMPLALAECEFMQVAQLTDRLLAEQVRFLARARFHPSEVPLVVGLDVVLLFRLIGRLLGESPLDGGVAEMRPLTPTDVRLGKRVVADLIDGLQDGLPQDQPQRLTLEAATDDPRMDLGLPAGTGLFRCVVEVGEPRNPLGRAIIALPAGAVPLLFGGAPSASDGPVESEEGLARVLALPVEAVAELARVPMTLSRIKGLEVGELIQLGDVRQAEVRVRDRPSLIVEAGVRDGVRCVRVVRNVYSAEGS